MAIEWQGRESSWADELMSEVPRAAEGPCSSPEV
jgi:hypothetical protein